MNTKLDSPRLRFSILRSSALSAPLRYFFSLILVLLFLPSLFRGQSAIQKPDPPSDIKSAAARAMRGRTGAVVVLDVSTAQLIASHRLEIASRRLARPGSAIKTFTLLALLESGKLAPSDSLLCPIKVRIGTRPIDCSHPQMSAPLDSASALAFSCNHFVATMSPRLSDEELTRALQRAGLFSVTGLVHGEAVGSIRASATTERHALKAIGQEDMEVTPLGLALAYRQLAQRIRKAEGTPALETVLRGLKRSVNEGMGANAALPDLQIAGKTGTASATDGTWTHAWFAGFAPADAPEIVVVVFLEKGRGGRDAAPIARDIFAAHAANRAQSRPTN
jgi:penicillin-binding protein 2